MTVFGKCVLAAACIALTAGAAVAQTGAPATRNALRFGLTYMSATGDQNFSDPFDYEGFTFKNEFDNELGVAVSYEYRFSDRLGLEFGAKYVKPDLKTRIDVETEPGGPRSPLYDMKDSVGMLPITAALNFRIAGSDPWSLYVAPELAYITYDDAEQTLVDLDFGDTVGKFKYQFKSEFTWGAKVGFDWGFTPAWALSASVEYIDAKAKIDSVDFIDAGGGPPERVAPYNDRKMNPKPIFVNVGVAYRF